MGRAPKRFVPLPTIHFHGFTVSFREGRFLIAQPGWFGAMCLEFVKIPTLSPPSAKKYLHIYYVFRYTYPNYPLTEMQNKRGFQHCQPKQCTIQCATGLNITVYFHSLILPTLMTTQAFQMQTTSHLQFLHFKFEGCCILSISRVLEHLKLY